MHSKQDPSQSLQRLSFGSPYLLVGHIFMQVAELRKYPLLQDWQLVAEVIQVLHLASQAWHILSESTAYNPAEQMVMHKFPSK